MTFCISFTWINIRRTWTRCLQCAGVQSKDISLTFFDTNLYFVFLSGSYVFVFYFINTYNSVNRFETMPLQSFTITRQCHVTFTGLNNHYLPRIWEELPHWTLLRKNCYLSNIFRRECFFVDWNVSICQKPFFADAVPVLNKFEWFFSPNHLSFFLFCFSFRWMLMKILRNIFQSILIQVITTRFRTLIVTPVFIDVNCKVNAPASTR